jgi:hypothetical protein
MAIIKVIAVTERGERVKESEGSLYALERLLNLARAEGRLRLRGRPALPPDCIRQSLITDS